jgi:hypothetical protein
MDKWGIAVRLTSFKWQEQHFICGRSLASQIIKALEQYSFLAATYVACIARTISLRMAKWGR